MTVELWNSDDCAAFLRCQRRHFLENFKPLPTFPRALYLPTIRGNSRPLWYAAEVQAWAAANLRPEKHEVTV